MLDIVLFREDQGGDPGKVRESQRRRYKDVGAVDAVIERDTKWRAARHKGDLLNRMGNVISKTVGEKKKIWAIESNLFWPEDDLHQRQWAFYSCVRRDGSVMLYKEVY